ncbi:MAG TPA: UTP--glucose-1-phosphate uridylyltransferase [Candidatus Saccharimonadales bacterium]|nr:UTP--glucose-1-phosphate uridylyltransferase [Candidatus Saccharimonadales bacterium]
MKNKVTKAIIPAAGLGTRFLPATKAMPKEMLPIVDKPVIQYVVEEIANSGIEDIVIVTGSSKRPIEDHFDRSKELEDFLKSVDKNDKAEEIEKIAKLANFIYIRQKGPYGNATPVIAAKHLVEDEPFAVVWGDEFIYAEPPRLKQLLDVYNKYQVSVISGVKIADKASLSKYGIAQVKPVEGNVYQIEKIVEKPNPDEAPSDIATHGAYVFTPSIWKYLDQLQPGKSGELWLADAIEQLIQNEPVYTVLVDNARYYDIGDKLGFIEANIEFALKRDGLAQPLSDYLDRIKK